MGTIFNEPHDAVTRHLSCCGSDAELPNTKPHKHHSYGQPTDHPDRNDCFESDARIGLGGTGL